MVDWSSLPCHCQGIKTPKESNNSQGLLVVYLMLTSSSRVWLICNVVQSVKNIKHARSSDITFLSWLCVWIRFNQFGRAILCQYCQLHKQIIWEAFCTLSLV